MNYRFMANPFKCAVALTTCLVLVVMAVVMAYINRPVSFLFFAALAVVFGLVTAFSGATLEISEAGIRRRILGRWSEWMSWGDIAEVGIAGTKVFNQTNRDKVGSLYIYFSPTSMSENERFQMMLRWPPMDKLYLIYDPARLRAVQIYWRGPLATFNVGKLMM